jgi:hypothetical protein
MTARKETIMIRRLPRHLAVVLTLVLSACLVDDPRYCTDNKACLDSAREGYQIANKYCHPTKHYCYAGCKADADCRNVSERMYEPDLPYCDPAQQQCVGAKKNAKNGEACGKGEECGSGHCVDQVCCNEPCVAGCWACSVTGSVGTCVQVPLGQDPRHTCGAAEEKCPKTCDGKGECSYTPTLGATCGEASCTSGKLTVPTCDASQSCAAQVEDCGGYACEADGRACKKSCASAEGDCVTGSFCENKECRDTREIGAECGTNDLACASEHCVEGVCCDGACSETCRSCKVAGSKGTCTKVTGDDTKGDCPGETACGGGQCEDGACAYFAPTVSCKTQCKTGDAFVLESFHCDGSGHCQATAEESRCEPGKCASAPAAGAPACDPSCLGHDDCSSKSVCDRSAAHVSGRGVCIAEDQVLAVSSGPLQTAVNDAVNPIDPKDKKTHLKLTGGPYADPENVTLSSGELTIVGIGSPTITSPLVAPPAGKGSGLSVSGSGVLTLQGVLVSDAKEDGVNCLSASSSAKVVIVESTISDNKGQGIDAINCTVTLHRNRIESNDGGGVSLINGTFTVVNNVVAQNGQFGTPGTTFGGFTLAPGNTGAVVFVNNTVTENMAKTNVAGGVICVDPSVTLKNSILSGSTGAQVSVCSYDYSDVDGWTTGGTGNIAQDPLFVLDGSYRIQTTSPCIDKGTDTRSVTAIDLVNTDRLKGGAVDLGAYEVQ